MVVAYRLGHRQAKNFKKRDELSQSEVVREAAAAADTHLDRVSGF